MFRAISKQLSMLLSFTDKCKEVFFKLNKDVWSTKIFGEVYSHKLHGFSVNTLVIWRSCRLRVTQKSVRIHITIKKPCLLDL